MVPIKILHLTPFYHPNVGGVETHLTDLVSTLDPKKYQQLILTYSPITTPNTKFKTIEKIGQNIIIRRFNWFGGNLFHKLEKQPLLNTLYLTPYLLVRSIFYILCHQPKIDVIHAHGLNSALIGLILKKIFKIKKLIVSIYSSYDNVPISPASQKFIKHILNSSQAVLTQSDSSIKQFKKLGINNVHRYYHWIDLNRFSPSTKNRQFTILFVGRMIPQKGAYLLAKITNKFPKINFQFIGQGQDFLKIKNLKQKNIKLLGNIDYSKLQHYYQKSHLLIIPSQYQEGWGRVAMESLACGTPVIASNLGGLNELLDSSVSLLIPPTTKNLTLAINKILNQPDLYQKLQKNSRPYALEHFSSKNIKYITQHY